MAARSTASSPPPPPEHVTRARYPGRWAQRRVYCSVCARRWPGAVTATGCATRAARCAGPPRCTRRTVPPPAPGPRRDPLPRRAGTGPFPRRRLRGLLRGSAMSPQGRGTLQRARLIGSGHASGRGSPGRSAPREGAARGAAASSPRVRRPPSPEGVCSGPGTRHGDPLDRRPERHVRHRREWAVHRRDGSPCVDDRRPACGEFPPGGGGGVFGPADLCGHGIPHSLMSCHSR